MAAGQKQTGLEFLLSLIDNLSGPAAKAFGKVQSRVMVLNTAANRATDNIRNGFIAGTSAAIGLAAAMGPAIKFNKELGQVSALGVSADAVGALKSEALELSNTFGFAASDVVNNARAIKRQMGDLGEAELLRVTRAATLAGQALGLENPAQVLAKSMQKIGPAQKALGMSLTDGSGRALGPTALIERLRGKFGNIDTAAESDLIRQAFGDESLQLMTTLINNAEILRGDLGAIAGTDLGRRLMATADPFDRLNTALQNVTITWGGFLIPLVTPWLDAVTNMARRMQLWAARFPHLTQLIGLLTVGILGLVLAGGALKIAWGLLTLAMLPIRGLMLGITAAQWAWNAAALANPVGLIVVSVLALGAALLLAWLFWDQVKAAALSFFDAIPGWVKLIMVVLQPLIWIPLLIIRYWERITELVGKARELAGVLFPGMGSADASMTSLTDLPALEPLAGETRQAISNAANSDNSRRTQIDRLTIETKEQAGPGYLQRVLAAEGLG